MLSDSDKSKGNNILPTSGELYYEPSTHLALCQPHLMPLKSLNLKKLDKLQEEANKAWMDFKKKSEDKK